MLDGHKEIEGYTCILSGDFELGEIGLDLSKKVCGFLQFKYIDMARHIRGSLMCIG